MIESLIFLTKKRNKVIKVKTYTNGSIQWDYIPKKEATSPTAAIESVLITDIIKVKEEWDMIILDIPNAFMQTKILEISEKQIIKFRGTTVDILLTICSGICDENITESKNGSKILHVVAQQAIYGMIMASIL